MKEGRREGGMEREGGGWRGREGGGQRWDLRPGSGVREITSDGVQSSPEEDTVGQSDIEEESADCAERSLPLPRLSSHLHNAQ